jgi:hypothetical protein
LFSAIGTEVCLQALKSRKDSAVCFLAQRLHDLSALISGSAFLGWITRSQDNLFLSYQHA